MITQKPLDMKNFINSINVTLFLCCIIIISSCIFKNKSGIREIYDSNGRFIGDSIFIDHKLIKINYISDQISIDSVVFSYFSNGKLKSVRTYNDRKFVFENIDYYSNGKPRTYLFVDEEKDDFYYKRTYDGNGKCINEDGVLFFQGYMDKINSETLEVKADGKKMHVAIYHPLPPDCNAFLYVRFDSLKSDMFRTNSFIPYLKELWIDIDYDEQDKDMWSKVIFGLDIINGKDTSTFEKPFYFKIVK